MTICVASGESRVAFPSGESEPADTGDAGDGLPAKSHGCDGLEVVRRPDFAGGVPFETQERVVPAHAHPVVHDPNATAPAGLDLDRDLSRVRVEGILDQFLDHAGGPFDDFAGGDLIGHLLGKKSDAIHPATLVAGSANDQPGVHARPSPGRADSAGQVRFKQGLRH